jgi:protein O-GlcNAc transferase
MEQPARVGLERVKEWLRLGDLPQAEDEVRRVLQNCPADALAWTIFAEILGARGESARAEDAYLRAISLAPDASVPRMALGVLYEQRGQLGRAVAQYDALLALTPESPHVLNNLGGVLQRTGELKRACELLSKAVALNPGSAPVQVNLAIALSSVGRQPEALEHLNRAVRLDPAYEPAHHARLLTLNYALGPSPEEVAEAHFEYGRVMAQKCRELSPRAMQWPLGRRLRVGLLSADFRRHSVSYFLEPLLENLSREDFCIFGYSVSELQDEVTVRIRELCAVYREAWALSDADLARLIRADEIDLLIDLNGHTAGGRLGVFARRPAPVAITYLGYPNTTGLSPIDFRITDWECDPAGTTEDLHSETLLRLDGGFLCYRPPVATPEAAPCPSTKNGFFTFGSFNALAKVTDYTLSLWQRILAAEPNSRLLLKQNFGASSSTREAFEVRLVAANIPIDRVDLLGAEPDPASHFATYGLMDLALDTFPYHGTTTTCDALYMGVPVVSLAGKTHVSRVGVSLLARVGLSDLVADSADAYVARAIALAHDLERRQSLRRGMRTRMAEGGLTDGPRFAKRFGALLLGAYTARAESQQRAGGTAACEIEAANDQQNASTTAALREPPLPDVDCRWLRLNTGLYLAAPASLDSFEGYVLEEQAGWYEAEAPFVPQLVALGQHALDLGAGVGVYTASMAAAAGPSGSVDACADTPQGVARIAATAARNRLPGISAGLALPRPAVEPALVPCFVRVSPSELPDHAAEELLRLCLHGKPVVMVEMARDPELSRSLMEALQRAGSTPYRMLPGLRMLYPYPWGSADFPLLSNLFAVPHERVDELQQSGLLAKVTDAAPAPPEACLWAYGRTVSTLIDVDLVQSFAAAHAGKQQHRLALLHYASAQRLDASPAQRAASLRSALAFAIASIEEPSNVSRLSTLARIASDWGQRSIAVHAIETALTVHRAGKGSLSEPFLPACARYDTLSAGTRHAEHAISALLEQYERSAAYSTFFTRDDPETLRRLLMLHKLGFQNDEMARRLSLVRRAEPRSMGSAIRTTHA